MSQLAFSDFGLDNNVRMSTSNTSAISFKVSSDGYLALLHHKDIVDWFLFNFSANHLFFTFSSANTT